MELFKKLKDQYLDTKKMIPNQLCHEAADLIEKQAAELEAARAEIEQLKASPSIKGASLRQMEILEQQLAACQAENARLRENVQKFIESLEECTDFEGFTAYIATMDDYHEAVEALSTPSDTSALEAIVKKAGEKMRERVLDPHLTRVLQGSEMIIADAIRALPAVTLEDLK